MSQVFVPGERPPFSEWDRIHWKAVFTLQQASFRGRTEAAGLGLNSASFTQALNTNWSQPLDNPFRVRFVLQEIAGAGGTIPTVILSYSLNGGAYAAVDAATPVRFILSANFAHNDLTTQLLNGSGTFAQGRGAETASAPSAATLAASGNSEYEFSVVLSSAAMAVGDFVDLQVREGASTPYLGGSSQTARVTAIAALVFTPDQTAYQFAEDGTQAAATLIGSLNTPLSRTL